MDTAMKSKAKKWKGEGVHTNFPMLLPSHLPVSFILGHHSVIQELLCYVTIGAKNRKGRRPEAPGGKDKSATWGNNNIYLVHSESPMRKFYSWKKCDKREQRTRHRDSEHVRPWFMLEKSVCHRSTACGLRGKEAGKPRELN